MSKSISQSTLPIGGMHQCFPHPTQSGDSFFPPPQKNPHPKTWKIDSIKWKIILKTPPLGPINHYARAMLSLWNAFTMEATRLKNPLLWMNLNSAIMRGGLWFDSLHFNRPDATSLVLKKKHFGSFAYLFSFQLVRNHT